MRGVLYLLGAISVAHSQSLIQNGDFEAGMSPWKCDRGTCNAEIQDGAIHVTNRNGPYASAYQMLNTAQFAQADVALRFSLSVKAEEDMYMGMMIRVKKVGVKKPIWATIGTWNIKADTWEDLWFTYTIEDPMKEGDIQSVKLYTRSNTTAGYWMDNVVFEPADDQTWRKQANDRIDRLRKRDVRVVVQGDDTEGLHLEVKQITHAFPFGTQVHAWDINTCQVERVDSEYCKFARDNFNWIVAQNFMKWSRMEPEQGQVSQSIKDLDTGMMEWGIRNGLKIRGHLLLWAKAEKNQGWLHDLPPTEFVNAVNNRLDFATEWAAPYVSHWDVNNEMINHYFYQRHSKNPNFRTEIFKRVKSNVPNTTLFVNDYGILNNMENRFPLYLEQVRGLLTDGAPVDAIGIQSHLGHTRVDPDYFQYVVETLHNQTGLPVWITEFDFNKDGQVRNPQGKVNAKQLEDFYRIMFSLEAVEGIFMWGFNEGWWSLLKGDYQPNSSGEAYLRLYHDEWRTNEVGDLTNGEYKFRGFRGDYSVKVMSGDTVVGDFKFNLDEDTEIQCTQQSSIVSCTAA